MKTGDLVRIIYMDGEPDYAGKEGTITYIGTDPWGDNYLRGTWGGCSIYPRLDKFEIIESK